MQLYKLSIFLLTLLCSYCSWGTESLSNKPEVHQFINRMVTQYGFNRTDLTNTLNQVVFQPQIIESMDRPYESKTWDVYKQLFLTHQRLQGGLDFWRANTNILSKVEKEYGVPANIIVAIIGVETLYGKHQGTYRVLDALATLAFYYPKRSVFFTNELAEFLLLCREHHVSPTLYLGSYAGAMGKPQFMPSSYRNYATDFSRNPKKDLMNDDQAVIASVANYFKKHGWIPNQTIAQPATVIGSGFKRIDTTYRNAAYTPRQLQTAGVKPDNQVFSKIDKVGLIALTTQNGQEFWLAYPNFYVITRYNASPQYALAVYLLAQQLQTEWQKTNHFDSLT